MPRLAIALYALWFVSLFVLRTALQWRRTGATGLKGFRGRIGSLPWIAGASITLGLLLAAVAPVAVLLGWPGGALLVAAPLLHVAGAACVVAGAAGALLAQLAMGDSWRVGVDPAETTALVTTGPFAWARNPIFSFMGLSMLGLVWLVPNLLSLLAGALTVLGIQLQVRAVEEPHLRRAHGVEYEDYASRVGRFVPGVGRLERTGRASAREPARR